MRVLCLLLLFPAILLAEPVKSPRELTRIAFGSCLNQDRPAPIFDAILAAKPDLFIWMGDSVYTKSGDVEALPAAYEKLDALPGVAALRQKVPTLATWDDHDFGTNNGGASFKGKNVAFKAFHDWRGTPADSPLRDRDGVYSVHDFGPADRLVRVILLDTRYNRSPLRRKGPSSGTILGEKQWSWLERHLLSPKPRLVILVSSIQVLPTEHRFEKWANFPAERQRLLDLLSHDQAPHTIILSGDRHLAEVSQIKLTESRHLHEITSSSLNFSFGGIPEEKNDLRIGENYGKENFGLISLNLKKGKPHLRASIGSLEGSPRKPLSLSIPFHLTD